MNKKEFNISEWINKKTESTSIANKKFVSIPEIRGDDKNIRANSWTKGKAHHQSLLIVVRCLLTFIKKSNLLHRK